MSNLLLDLDQAAEVLGVKRTTVFKLLRDGDLKGVKIGRRRLIPRTVLEAYVHGLMGDA